MKARRRGRRAAGRGPAALCLVVGLLALPAPRAPAHPLAPALLEIVERIPGSADVHWKTSRLRPRGQRLEPRLPADCRRAGEPSAEQDATSVTLAWTVECGGSSLIGKRIAVDGLETAGIDVLVRIALADGRVVNEVLRARRPGFTVPERPASLDVLKSYLALGMEHILMGLDHLLFVLGLMLLVTRTAPLVRTITAFTLGHSVTLSLVALGVTRVPSGWVELCIAASVLVLAVEIADRDPARPRWLERRPWAMAAGFGLLHGMGFAGALAEIGLPQGEIPLALFAFNVGIELGQLGFVLAIATLRVALRVPLAAAPPWAARLPAYAIGSLAAFWCFERAAALL